jgi:dTDP-4-dehydrorhamnose reductase
LSRPGVLLAGASGRLGTGIRETLGSAWDIVGQSLSGAAGTLAADLSTPAGRRLALDAPFDLAVNAAAVSSTALCRENPSAAWAVNVRWPMELARECGSRGAPLIHFSSDLVYSGGVPPYEEDSPAAPRSLYGWTKLLADMLVTRIHPGALVLRTSVLFGELGGERTTFSGDLLRGRVRSVYVDCWRNHTPIHWLASILPELIASGTGGKVMAAARYSTSRSAFAEALLGHLGRDASGLEFAYSPEGTPRRLHLLPGLLERLLGREAPDVPQSIALEYGRSGSDVNSLSICNPSVKDS